MPNLSRNGNLRFIGCFMSQFSDLTALSMMFPTFLGEARFPDFADEKRSLLASIDRVRREDTEGAVISKQYYAHGYTSFFTRNTLYNDPGFERLAAFICEQATYYSAKQFWDLQRFEPLMTSMWCNVNGKHSYHAEHLHPFSHISGVFYINCSRESGDIAFKDPRPGRMMVPPPAAQSVPENSMVVKIIPEDGKLLMFPSFLEHSVAQNPTDTERVSISFNFEMRQRVT
jgi:uncharacterized protein (TIGR02466 family)